VILVGLTVYFQIAEGRDVAQLLGYELPPVIALMGASLALGDGVRTRRLLKESQRERERHARMELERRATEQRNETGDGREVPVALGQAAYRIVQEALTNVIRHANATTAVVTLDRGPDALTVTVRDNGQAAGELMAGNGIRGMRERATEWRGELTVSSSGRGPGTAVTAVLPLPQSTEPRSAEPQSPEVRADQ
jgi:signal transduction histidine kinase